MENDNRMTRFCLSILIVCVLILSVYGTASGEGSAASKTVNINIGYLESNQELLEEYIRREMYSIGGKKSEVKTAGYPLPEGENRRLYDKLLADIKKVAAGKRTSTVFSYDAADIYDKTELTKDDLNIDNVYNKDGSLTQEAIDALDRCVGIDVSPAIEALMFDCPYELYWFDKESGLSTDYPQISIVDETFTVTGQLTLMFCVSEDYAKDNEKYECDPKYGSSVEAAVSNAKKILDKYQGQSDRDRLMGYAKEICDLVSYNNEAMNGGAPYGNPWQLIWVFDGDENTNVVCEGYSKAFQYLCDLSTFTSNTRVITVSGYLYSESHMWNIVRLNDGANYLADVTNTDSGSQLMLVECDYGNYEEGYTILVEGASFFYSYDNPTKKRYSMDELTLNSKTPSQDVVIDTASFPDEVFRKYVQDTFDEDHNGTLDQIECANVTGIIVPEMGIKSLKGIQYFPNLNILQATRNDIDEIDLRHNPSIGCLFLEYNQLTEIDVSSLPLLGSLHIEENPIKTLDVSNNPLLEGLYTSYTRLQSIDVSGNKELRFLDCQATDITKLDVSHNTKLEQLICQVVSISSIDLSHNPELTSLWISDTDITSLDVSHNPKLTQLFCAENSLTYLDLSNNPLMEDLRADGISNVLPASTVSYDMNTIDGFDKTRTSNWSGADFNQETGIISNIKDSIIRYTYDCGNNWSIEVTFYLTGDVAVNENSFPDPVFRQYILDNYAPNGVLTPDQMLHVENLYMSGMDITSLKGIELFPNLINLYCDGTHVKELVLSTHSLLNLFINNTQITKLDIETQPTLSYLDISHCPISDCSLAGFPNLDVLYCIGTNITSLDISGCPQLVELVQKYEPVKKDGLCHWEDPRGWPVLYVDSYVGIYIGGTTPVNIPDPTPEPTPEPTEEPTEEPTPEPTEEPTDEPTPTPTPTPTPGPTDQPTTAPTSTPTTAPTPGPGPTDAPKPDGITGFVTRCYQLILGRNPDPHGLETWYNNLNSGLKAAAEIIDSFVRSNEFKGKNHTNEESVEILYNTMLGRGSDPKGKANWVAKLEAGQPLAAVINGFCGSNEFKAICESYGIKPGSVDVPEEEPKTPDDKIKAFVKRCYKIILGRGADETGLNNWFNALKSRQRAASEIIDGFVRSVEFMGKGYTNEEAVEILYKAMLGRGSDPKGKANWVAKLNAGQPLAVVINGFCGSQEFTGLCASYGIEPGRVSIPEVVGQAEVELSYIALNAEEPITKRSEDNPNRVSIINPSDTIDPNIGTAVQAVYINEEKAKEYVSRCYRYILGRSASERELAGWVGQMTNGTKTADQIARGFLFSDEFRGRNIGNMDLVKILYRVYLNRDADPAGLASWTAKLDSGVTLKEVLDSLVKTGEYKNILNEMRN